MDIIYEDPVATRGLGHQSSIVFVALCPPSGQLRGVTRLHNSLHAAPPRREKQPHDGAYIWHVHAELVGQKVHKTADKGEAVI